MVRLARSDGANTMPIKRQPLQRDDQISVVQLAVGERCERSIDSDAQRLRVLGFMRRTRPFRHLRRVDDGEKHRGVLVVDAGRRQKAE